MFNWLSAAVLACLAGAAPAAEFTYVLTGEGTLTYLYMQKCQWAASAPQDRNNCVIDRVQDGGFTQGEQDAMAAYANSGTQDNPRKGMQLDIEDAIADVSGVETTQSPDETAQQVLDILNRLPGLKLD